jgi:hypothetical protein
MQILTDFLIVIVVVSFACTRNKQLPQGNASVVPVPWLQSHSNGLPLEQTYEF